MPLESEIWASGCELAGLLAERGIVRVTLNAGDESRLLVARETDLPRELFGAPPGSRLTWDGGAAVRETVGWQVVAGPGPSVQG